MTISNELWFSLSLLRSKNNSLEDGAKEVAFSMLNHLITLKKKTWSSGSYKKYGLLNHFVCSVGKAHFLQYHTWTVLFLWRHFCLTVLSRILLVCYLWKYFSHGRNNAVQVFFSGTCRRSLSHFMLAFISCWSLLIKSQ